jgi:diguanylate cyclase (GGDEF)-like protein
MSSFSNLSEEIAELSRQSTEQLGFSRMESLEDENELLRAVVDNFPGGLQLIDKNLKLVFCNDTLKRMLDYPQSLFAFGNPGLEQLFRFNAQRGEYGAGPIEEHVAKRMELVRQRSAHTFQRTRPNGVTLEIRGVPLAGGGFMTTYIDVSDQHQRMLQGQVLADIDLLTGLPKAPYMRKHIADLLSQMRQPRIAALLCLDLDQFHSINLHYGRTIGDHMLKEIGSRLKGLLRGNDPVARIGGDSFMVLQYEVKRPSDVARLASRISGEISRPIQLGSELVTVTPSIGIALIPRDGNDVDTLMEKAQKAAMAPKDRSRGGLDTATDWT